MRVLKFCFLVLILSSNLLAIPAVRADLTCDALNTPAGTKGLIITIIEEPIGKPTTTGESVQVLDCFRKTDCSSTPCKDTYADNCTPATGATPTSGVSCKHIQIFSSTSGAELLYSYIGIIYRWAAGVIGIVCVLYLVYGGIRIATAGDNTGAIDEAKQKIFQSLTGLILLFLSAVILYTINPNFFTV